jgi:hypothetical protein
VDGLTLLVTISAIGVSLPLFFLAKPTPARVKSAQAADVRHHWNSPNNVRANDSLNFIHADALKDDVNYMYIDLIFHIHSSIRTGLTEIIEKAAGDRNIELHSVLFVLALPIADNLLIALF